MTTESQQRHPARAKVAVLFTRPETVLEDHERLLELADFRRYLDPSAPTAGASEAKDRRLDSAA